MQQKHTNTATPSAAEALSSLVLHYRRWWDVLRSCGEWDSAPIEPICKHITNALSCFSNKHQNQPEEVAATISELAKGVELIKTALSWENAMVGAKSSKTDLHRGAQWRLVIAWCGLETIICAVCRCENISVQDLRSLISNCELSPFAPLQAPKRTRTELEAWLKPEGKRSIENFLGLRKSSVEIVRRWLIEGKSIDSWTDAMQLAKVFRHVTAHGALSASKVDRWGLRHALDQLVPLIGIVAAASFQRLEQGEIVGTPSSENRASGGGMIALSLKQPYAEAITRGILSILNRSQSTTIRGRIYIYASAKRLDSRQEADLISEFGLGDLPCDDIPGGVIIGTVVLSKCVANNEKFDWHFQNPNHFKNPKPAKQQPTSVWFDPF